ncbi:MAG: hypothetical protein IJO16_01900 [Clostridia bacterium]|nr:hypothetical protein [Clostridia bacterium]
MTKYITKRAVYYIIIFILLTLALFAILRPDTLISDREMFKFFASPLVVALYDYTYPIEIDGLNAVYAFDEYYSDGYWGYLKPIPYAKHIYRKSSADNIAHLGYKSLFDMHTLKFSHFENPDGSELRYTYSKVFELIYKINDHTDIESIEMNGISIRAENDIERIYDAISNEEWIIDARSSRTKYDTLPLSFKLKNGETIDILGYNHQYGKLSSADNRSVFNLTKETSALFAELFEIK